MSDHNKPRGKVLHLITGLGIGGAESMLLKLVPALEKDLQNHVCCLLGHGQTGEALESLGIPVSYLELNRNPIGACFRFFKVVRRFKPNILLTYLIHSDLFGRVFGRLYGIPTIICSQRGSLQNWEFIRPLDRFTSFLVTHYIAQTVDAKQKLLRVLSIKSGKVLSLIHI
jgi:hypothetical protein